MKEYPCISSNAALSIALLFFFLITFPLQSQSTADKADPWITNFQDARETATAEKKDLAILFTASDWLDLAQTFDKEILSQEEFLKSAINHYILVRLDFPKDTSIQPSQTTTQNQQLMRVYRVRGFPTLILTDSLGRPYAITGYHKGGLTSWVAEFKQLRQTREKRDRLFGEAKKVEGVERARLLAQALPELPGNLTARYYRNIIDEIIKLDPDNKTSRIGYYKLLIADIRYSDQMQKLAMKGDDSQMLEVTDNYLKAANLEGTTKQNALFNKVNIYGKQRRTAELKKTLQEIIAIDPGSAQGIQAAQLLKELAPDSKKDN